MAKTTAGATIEQPPDIFPASLKLFSISRKDSVTPGGRKFSTAEADDPRLDPIWEMAAQYDKPVMIHLSDSVGRFYPIGPKSERYEAGLWHQPGDTPGNYYESGPRREVIEQALENMQAKHPKRRFVNAHMSMMYYDPEKVGHLLDT